IAPGIIAVNTPAADPIINWTAVGGSDFSGGSVASGTAIPEQFANEGALCQGTGAYHAVLWDKVTNIGTVELKAIAYVPAKSTYGIQPLCGADTTILWNDEKSMTTIWPKDKAGKENPFILSEGKGEAAKEEFTIVKILDKLKNGQLCMKTTSNDVKFFWNADKLLESTSTVTPMEDMGH
ncbi:MAG: hypothetical protein J4415_03405, partial [Candidatus Diapherotrites archaeon]|nr:hypothetical protein [Candidatus Diapherotrites archaeon]